MGLGTSYPQYTPGNAFYPVRITGSGFTPGGNVSLPYTGTITFMQGQSPTFPGIPDVEAVTGQYMTGDPYATTADSQGNFSLTTDLNTAYAKTFNIVPTDVTTGKTGPTVTLVIGP